jgi:GNAT superfamily N-acetyltransferase
MQPDALGVRNRLEGGISHAALPVSRCAKPHQNVAMRETAQPTTDVRRVTPERLPDVARLFETNGTTRGCWCQAFTVSRSEYQQGWHDGSNRTRFEAAAATAGPPIGLLAYRSDEPVGWCAVGPRDRYRAAIGKRARIMRNRDPAEDDRVFFVSCMFVRVGFRGSGVTYELVGAAVDLARELGAPAIEGWPRAGNDRQQSDLYYGRESLFAEFGFRVIDRPSPKRAVMRLDLA